MERARNAVRPLALELPSILQDGQGQSNGLKSVELGAGSRESESEVRLLFVPPNGYTRNGVITEKFARKKLGVRVVGFSTARRGCNSAGSKRESMNRGVRRASPKLSCSAM